MQERNSTSGQVAASQLLASTEGASSSHNPDPQTQAPPRGRSAQRGGRAVRPLPSYGNNLPAQQQVRQLQMLRLQHTAARGAKSQVSCLLGLPAAGAVYCAHRHTRSQIPSWFMIQRNPCSVRQSVLGAKHVASCHCHSQDAADHSVCFLVTSLRAVPLSLCQPSASHARSCPGGPEMAELCPADGAFA